MAHRRPLPWLLPLAVILSGCAATSTTTTTTPTATRTSTAPTTTKGRGGIHGTLRLTTAAATASSPGHAGHGTETETPTDAVIYIEEVPAAEPPPAAAPATQPPAAEATGQKSGKTVDWLFGRSTGSKRAREEASTSASGSPGKNAKATTALAPAPRGGAASGKTAKTPTPNDGKAAGSSGAKKGPSPGSRQASGAEAPPARVATMGQVDHHFVPRVLAVEVGTTVQFENRDRVYHNVFSVSPVRRFDTGKYAPRQVRPIAFEKPGVVKLYCDIDPSMAGFVFVVPGRHFTQPSATGSFSLPDLPPGTYTLTVWHPTLGQRTRQVEMPEKGDAIVDFEL